MSCSPQINFSMAFLKRECPFYALFKNGHVPITGAAVGELKGFQERDVYICDTSRWTKEQIEGVAEIIAQKNDARMLEVLVSIQSGTPLPLRKSQCEGHMLGYALRAFV
jgi:hypothetical protein